MDYWVTHPPGTRTMIVRGPLDMNKADELSRVLTDTLAECQHLVFQVEGVEHLCFNSFELLCSVCQRAGKEKKRFSVSDNNTRVSRWIWCCTSQINNEQCALIHNARVSSKARECPRAVSHGC